MIKELRRRFIRIALVALATAMLLVALAVNAANWFSVRSELNETLSFLMENSGMNREDIGRRMLGKDRHDRNLVSESSWFSAVYDADGQRRSINLLNMADPSEDAAAQLLEQAIGSGRKSGMIQDYLYQIRETSLGGQLVLMLNCETKLTAVRTLALISLLACVGGILLAWLFVTLASRKAIEPMIRNMERQKQFITDASHEMKTPLAVIAANMDLMQMELPDNPWIKSTQKQTGQMLRLVDELVYLSRMEEENAPLVMEILALSPLIQEAAEPFAAMAEYQGKRMEIDTENGLTLRGDRASVQRLLSTLLDNAVKYTPEEGGIRINALSEGRRVLLTVSNDVARPLTEEQCGHLFDRFYRADPSRSKEKQTGFGIGLAIAAAIVEKHGGTISAAMEDGRLVFTCKLPKGGGAA